MDERRLTCPFEDWVKEWNHKIDATVGHYNLARPSECQQLRQNAKRHHELGAEQLRQLRSFYFAGAGKTSSDDTESTEGTEVSLFGFC